MYEYIPQTYVSQYDPHWEFDHAEVTLMAIEAKNLLAKQGCKHKPNRLFLNDKAYESIIHCLSFVQSQLEIQHIHSVTGLTGCVVAYIPPTENYHYKIPFVGYPSNYNQNNKRTIVHLVPKYMGPVIERLKRRES